MKVRPVKYRQALKAPVEIEAVAYDQTNHEELLAIKKQFGVDVLPEWAPQRGWCVRYLTHGWNVPKGGVKWLKIREFPPNNFERIEVEPRTTRVSRIRDQLDALYKEYHAAGKKLRDEIAAEYCGKLVAVSYDDDDQFCGQDYYICPDCRAQDEAEKES